MTTLTQKQWNKFIEMVEEDLKHPVGYVPTPKLEDAMRTVLKHIRECKTILPPCTLPKIERSMTDIHSIADTIIWLVNEQIKEGSKSQNLNSEIHAVDLEISNYLMDFMKEFK